MNFDLFALVISSVARLFVAIWFARLSKIVDPKPALRLICNSDDQVGDEIFLKILLIF